MKLLLLAIALTSVHNAGRTHKKSKASRQQAEEPALTATDAQLQAKYLECYELPRDSDDQREAAKACYTRFLASVPKRSEYAEKARRRLQELQGR